MEQIVSNRTKHHQIIDDQKVFYRASIQELISELKDVGKQYSTIAIIGVQNSGKSTLLNAVFGTNFQVLKGLAGNRTTKGILASLDKSSNMIIMDVEGNDAMDRAQQMDYERKISSFALVSANVLVINIWSKSLGQYTGSQYQTLKIVFEICLEQFKQQSPKTILYCVRDFNQEYDNEVQIRMNITYAINNIWRQISKPQQYSKYDNEPQKFFKLQVFCLHRYRPDKPSQFIKDAQKLRQRFINPQNGQYLLDKIKYDYNLPISDIPNLFQNMWNSIKNNEKLNLPNQKQQLSVFRCSAIQRDICQEFEKELNSYGKQAINYGQLYKKRIQQYEKSTYDYNKASIIEYENQMKEEMHHMISIKINDILNSKEKLIIFNFTESSRIIDQKNCVSLNLQLMERRQKAVQEYVELIKKLNYEIPKRKERIDQLGDQLAKISEQVRQNKLEFIKEYFQKSASRILRILSTEVIRDYFGTQFWKCVENQFLCKKAELIQQYEEGVKWVNGVIDQEQCNSIQLNLEKQLKTNIREQLQKTLVDRIVQKFLLMIKKDTSGNTYNFNAMQQQLIGDIFDEARDNINKLISEINRSTLREPKIHSLIEGFEETQSLFESSWMSTVSEQIDKRIIAQYETIIRRKVLTANAERKCNEGHPYLANRGHCLLYL